VSPTRSTHRRPSLGQPGRSLADAIIQAGQLNTKTTTALAPHTRPSIFDEVIDLTMDDGDGDGEGISRASKLADAIASAEILSSLFPKFDSPQGQTWKLEGELDSERTNNAFAVFCSKFIFSCRSQRRFAQTNAISFRYR
jgi:hypothetical protein